MEVEIKLPSDIPNPDGNYSETAIAYECSDFYFALAENPTGEVFKCLICYDFRDKKWRGVQSGVTKIIEYYILKK